MASFIILHSRRDIYFFDSSQEPMGGNMSNVYKGIRLSDIKIASNQGRLNLPDPEVIKIPRPNDSSSKIGALNQLPKTLNPQRIHKELLFILEHQIVKPIAIKVLLKDLASNAMYKERFERESQITIEHDNVIRNIDYVFVKTKSGDKHHIIMEFLQGKTLREWIHKERRTFTELQILKITRQLLSGLEAIHAQGLIHRDIKAANVMFDAANDRIKIMDFGIIKSYNSNQSNLTGIATFIGTLSYAAPEQVRLQNFEVGAWTDLWAVGVLMYEMLTSQLPFDGENDDETKRKILEEPLPNIDMFNSSIVRIIKKATEKEIRKRYQRTNEFEEDLSKVINELEGGASRRLQPENSYAINSGINPWLIVSILLSIIILIIFVFIVVNQ